MSSLLETLRANIKRFAEEKPARDRAAALAFVERVKTELLAESEEGVGNILIGAPPSNVLEIATPLLEAEGLYVRRDPYSLSIGFCMA